MKYLTALLTLATIFSSSAGAQVVRGTLTPQKNSTAITDSRPNGKGWGEPDLSGAAANTATPVKNGISYHGGAVMLGTTHLYYIWYGNWAGDPGQSILLNLANSIGGTRYFNINTTYYDQANHHVSKYVTYRGSTTDKYSKGATLNDAAVQAIVSSAIASGRLPKDSHGVYFVLTSKDVKETSGFCSKYCGWHNRTTIAGTDIKFAFVGNSAQQCPLACEQQTTRSPNADPGADGMASVIAHELAESVSDPHLNAWYDSNGLENADKCAWGFGTVRRASNSSQYNITLGGRQYLLQRIWVNASGGYCAMSF